MKYDIPANTMEALLRTDKSHDEIMQEIIALRLAELEEQLRKLEAAVSEDDIV